VERESSLGKYLCEKVNPGVCRGANRKVCYFLEIYVLERTKSKKRGTLAVLLDPLPVKEAEPKEVALGTAETVTRQTNFTFPNFLEWGDKGKEGGGDFW